MTDDNTANDLTADTESPEGDAPAAEASLAPGEDQAAPGDAENGQTGTADGEAPTGEPTPEERPREVIKGIHPELKCEDQVCAPEYTELQFFSPEEAAKQKGQIMLFCARSGKKYFAPAAELQAWIAENKVAKTGRGRKDG